MVSLYDNLWLDADDNCFMLKSDERVDRKGRVRRDTISYHKTIGAAMYAAQNRAVRAAVKQASTYQELKELLSKAENKMMAVMQERDRQYHAVTSPGTPGQSASNKEDSI